MPLATRPTRRWTVFRESERGITDENRRRIGSCRIHLQREDQAIPERSGARGYGFWNRLGGACRLSSLHSASRRSRSAWRRRVRRGSGRLWKRRSDGRQPRQKHPLRSLLECRIGKTGAATQ